MLCDVRILLGDLISAIFHPLGTDFKDHPNENLRGFASADMIPSASSTEVKIEQGGASAYIHTFIRDSVIRRMLDLIT